MVSPQIDGVLRSQTPITNRDRAERAARVHRPGDPATLPEPELQGTPAVELACELTRAAYALLGEPVRVTPRAEWPGAVHRASSQ